MRMRFLLLTLIALPATPQQTITARANEVHVRLHAEDYAHHPITDLKPSDLSLRDNGEPQQIISLTAYHDLPLRLGFFFDTSGSMQGYPLARSRDIASYLSQHLFEANDQAFLREFDFEEIKTLDFSTNTKELASAINHVGSTAYSRLGGTALYDELYRGCRDHFASISDGSTANAIILFSDGGDTESHAYLSEVITKCQETRTAFFIFYSTNKRYKEDIQHLKRLAERSGGALFLDQKKAREDFYKSQFSKRFGVPSKPVSSIDPATIANLKELIRRLRSQYEMVYRMPNLKRDGKFHTIEIKAPHQPVTIQSRTGYYAPTPNE